MDFAKYIRHFAFWYLFYFSAFFVLFDYTKYSPFTLTVQLFIIVLSFFGALVSYYFVKI